MAAQPISLIEDADRARLALSPIRRRLLELLREPGSATTLAAKLELSRQQVGYHLRALEQAGLLTLVEERARRGFTERVLQARSEAFVIDPQVMAPAPSPEAEAQDRYAAEHLVNTAAALVRDVARQRAAASEEGRRLLTFTLESEIAFARPGDVERFAERLTALVAGLAQEFDAPEGGRPYRLVVGAHPAPQTRARPKIN